MEAVADRLLTILLICPEKVKAFCPKNGFYLLNNKPAMQHILKYISFFFLFIVLSDITHGQQASVNGDMRLEDGGDPLAQILLDSSIIKLQEVTITPED